MAAADDREELRLALVMSGGVSLAVWMGGATYEIGRLVADSGSTAYSELCALSRVRPKVDVIAGTSAGGINGAYLAMAMAYHKGRALEQKLEDLRNLWINDGALRDLLRGPFSPQPPSLLDGDGYFLTHLNDAFRKLRDGGSLQDGVPIELLLTTTLLDPELRVRSDAFGVRIADVSHRATLHFRRSGRPGGHDDFAADKIADRLALAARCTSSFPAAFEPSYCPVGDAGLGELHPDMNGIASFNTGSFVIDGGVLDNQPLDAAIREVFHQRATGPVRRVLAHIVPDPGGSSVTPSPANPGLPPPPDMLDVLMSTLVRIPMVQSIGDQIDSLGEHNTKVRDRIYARVLLTNNNPPQQIDDLSVTLFSAYRAVRLEMAVNYIINEIQKGLLRDGLPGLGQSGRRDWLHQQMVQRFGKSGWLPGDPPNTAPDAPLPNTGAWAWGTRPIEHSVRVLLDLLGRTQRLARLVPKVPPDDPAYLRPDFLHDEWQRCFELLENTATLRDRDAEHWRSQSSAVQAWLGTGHGKSMRDSAAGDWLDQALNDWQRQPGDGKAPTNLLAGQYATQIAQVLIDVRPCIQELLHRCADGGHNPQRARQVKELHGLYGYFVRDGETPSVGAVVGRLLAFEVVQEALGGRGTVPEEEIDLIQISAEGSCTFGGSPKPADKLAGVQLAHFGAFYKQSWRANDWMWGRLDSVRRLVRILLDPESLLVASLAIDQGQRAETLARGIATIALGQSPATGAKLSPDAQAELLNGFSIEPIIHELGYLDHPQDVMPEFLTASVGAVCRRLELEILQEELPLIADSVQADQADQARLSPTAQNFLIACGRWSPPATSRGPGAPVGRHASRGTPTAAGPIPANKVRTLLQLCHLGREKIEDDVGTDRLTVMAAQSTAVAISAMTRQEGWLVGFGKMMTAMRTPALLFYLFSRAALLESNTGVAANVFLLVAGMAIMITAPISQYKYPSWLLLIGIAAFLAGGLFLVVRLRLQWRVLALIAAAALVGIVRWQGWELPALPPAIWVSVAVLSVLWLALSLFWQLRRRSVRRAL